MATLNTNFIETMRQVNQAVTSRMIGAIGLAMLFAAQANAATLTITGPSEVSEGESFQIQISGDFGVDGLLAGGIGFSWDAALVQVDNVTLDLNVDPGFSCPGSANCPAPTANNTPYVWGQFLTDLISSGAGQTQMATLDVTALAPGTATFGMADIPALTGGWFGAGFVPIAAPTFSDFSVCIVDTSSDPDPDNDGVPNCFDPDDDNDGIADALDTNPVVANNNCTDNDGTNATLVEASVSDVQTCASKESVDVSGSTSVGTGGDLRLISESVSLTNTSVTDNGQMEVINADPCPGCSVCGNGIVEAWEQCDDGNTDDGDGCSAICQTEQ